MAFRKLAGAALALLALGPARAEDAPMLVAGGELDPAYPGADVYLSAPRDPAAPKGACATAKRYVDLVNAGDFKAVAALYADEATFLEPMRPTLRGRAEIHDFYTKRMKAMRPAIVAVAYLGNQTDCMVELARRVTLDDEERYVLVSIDHFIMGADGKILSMAAFARPPRS